MRIGLVSREYPPDTAWGGIGVYTHQLAHGLAARGHTVHVIALGLDGNQDVVDGPIHVHRVGRHAIRGTLPFLTEWCGRFEYSYRVYRKLSRLVEQHALGVVEAPNFFGEGFICALRRVAPLVIRLHTPFSEVIQILGWRPTLDLRLSCALEDAAIRRSDLVTCSTTAHSQFVARELGLDPSRIERIPLGIDVPDLHAEGPVPELPHPAVLFVGRLEKRKGIHALLRAFPQVLREVPDAHLFVIGRETYTDDRTSGFEGAPQYSLKEQFLRECPPLEAARVHFLGHKESEVLGGYYRACDLFVAPSLYESCGLVYLEAMAYAKPVIGCSVGGVPEVVEDGVTGLLVPPEDPVQLAAAMSRLLKDTPLRHEMGRQGRRRVETHFTRELMVERTLQAYRRLV